MKKIFLSTGILLAGIAPHSVFASQVDEVHCFNISTAGFWASSKGAPATSAKWKVYLGNPERPDISVEVLQSQKVREENIKIQDNDEALPGKREIYAVYIRLSSTQELSAPSWTKPGSKTVTDDVICSRLVSNQ